MIRNKTIFHGVLIVFGLIIIGATLFIYFNKPTSKTLVEQNLPETTQVTVDASKNLGEIPEVFGAGLMGSVWNDFEPMRTEAEGLERKPAWRLHFSWAADCPGGGADAKPTNFEKDLTNWLHDVDKQIIKFQQNGQRVILSTTQVPKWLSLYPSEELMSEEAPWMKKWQYSPPKDYTEWKNLIKLVASTQIDDGIKADYIIGDEPNWMFYGAEEQYLEMYMHTAKAIKEVDPNIKVGAPGVGSWSLTKDANCPDGKCPPKNHTIIEALISYVSKNNIPLDFIDWHFPGVLTIEEEVNTTRQWLKEAGLSEDLPLTIGEWVFSSKKEEESTEKGSAYVVPFLKALWDAGIYWHSGTSIDDQSGWTSGDWAHVGFFSLDGIIKAKWNSFKIIEKLTYNSERISVSNSPDFVTVIASQTKDKKTTRVLLSNFIPDPEQLALDNALKSFSGQSGDFFNGCCIELGAETSACWQALQPLYLDYLQDKKTVDDLESVFKEHCGLFPDYLKKDLENSKEIAKQVCEKTTKYQTVPRDVTINLKNLPFSGKVTLTTYIIDKEHSNPCRYNKKTEPVPTDTECGINGAVDGAVKSAKDETEKTTLDLIKQFLKSKCYSENDFSSIIKALTETCKGDLNCYKEIMIKYYFQLDRCKTASCSKCTEDIVIQELTDAYNLYMEAHPVLLYHGAYIFSGKTYSIPVYIDKINNDPNISLEGSKQERQIIITDGSYKETITMQPYGVMLLELSR